jgi:hypothetical protein
MQMLVHSIVPRKKKVKEKKKNMSRQNQNKITKLESSANLENKKQNTWKFS